MGVSPQSRLRQRPHYPPLVPDGRCKRKYQAKRKLEFSDDKIRWYKEDEATETDVPPVKICDSFADGKQRSMVNANECDAIGGESDVFVGPHKPSEVK